LKLSAGINDFARGALVNFGVFELDAFDQALPFHEFEAIGDLVSVWHEQRITAAQRNADLNAGETTRPIEHDPANCAGHAALFEYKVGDGRETAGF
jgi:hypothetical protein